MGSMQREQALEYAKDFPKEIPLRHSQNKLRNWEKIWKTEMSKVGGSWRTSGLRDTWSCSPISQVGLNALSCRSHSGVSQSVPISSWGTGRSGPLSRVPVIRKNTLSHTLGRPAVEGLHKILKYDPGKSTSVIDEDRRKKLNLDWSKPEKENDSSLHIFGLCEHN